MQAILIYLNNIWNTYPIQFVILIITITYTIARTVNDFLPTEYKINKRFNFLRKVEKVICQIKVSICLNKPINFKSLRDKFNGFWDENTSNVRDNRAPLSFYSKLSGSAYEINITEDDVEKKDFVTINNFNGFSIGTFGSLKNLDTAINEVQRIAELFNNERSGTDKITIEINITPKFKKYFDSKLAAEYTQNNCYYAYNCKNIKVVNNGYSSIKENISRIIYQWMEHFI